MATMGKYCKAYPIQQLCQFHNWTENRENTRKEIQKIDGKELENNRTLTDEDFLYLHENYLVTDGIYQDKNVIFDVVTPEWKDFCTNILLFEVINYG
jgi:hypothetical protein